MKTDLRPTALRREGTVGKQTEPQFPKGGISEQAKTTYALNKTDIQVDL